MYQQPAEATAAAVVLASGAGSRVGSALNKAYLPLAGRPLVTWSLDTLGRMPGVGVLLLVARPQDEEYVAAALDATSAALPVEVVAGGGDRQESELLALRHLANRVDSGAVDAILLHDAARPLASAQLAAEVLRTARTAGGAVPGVECTGLAVAAADGTYLSEPFAGRAVRAQTPQGFRAAPLVAAYEAAARENFTGTDTASCVERFTDVPVRWVRGEDTNIKITYPEDIPSAERIHRGISSFYGFEPFPHRGTPVSNAVIDQLRDEEHP